MMEMHSNDRQDISHARTGDIIAIAGLKDVTTGDTLCDEKHPIVLERMEFPDPVIKVDRKLATPTGRCRIVQHSESMPPLCPMKHALPPSLLAIAACDGLSIVLKRMTSTMAGTTPEPSLLQPSHHITPFRRSITNTASHRVAPSVGPPQPTHSSVG